MHPAVQDGLNAARYSQIAFALPKVSDGVVHRHQRGRAGGVDRFRLAGQTQEVGDTPAGAVQVGAAESVEASRCFGVSARVQDQHPVFVVADPRVDTGVGSFQPVGIDPSVLKGQLAHLQHHVLLRIE